MGATVLGAVQATRRLVSTNTNLGMVLLLAPLAAVPEGVDLAEGVDSVLEETTVADACLVYRAIRLAQPGGMGEVPDQDLGREPTMTLRKVMSLAAGRDLIALQYTNGFREVLGEGLQALRSLQEAGQPLETCIVGAHLHLLASHPDSLIERKYGADPGRGGFSLAAVRCLRADGRWRRQAGGFATYSTHGCEIRRIGSIREQPPTWSPRRCMPP